MKSLTEFIETPNITEGIKSGAGITGMLEYAHKNPPQTIVVEYTKLKWPKFADENSRGILRLTSTGKEYDRFTKKFLISGTGRVGFKDLECVVHVGNKGQYLMIDVIGGRPKDKYEAQIYVEFDDFNCE